MFGLKWPLSRRTPETSGGTGVMYLHGTDFGWRARILDRTGSEPPQDIERMDVGPPQDGERAIDMAFRLAGAPAPWQGRVGALHVLTDDPEIHYTDTRGNAFNTASQTSLGLFRIYGVQQLNTAKVCFGLASFGRAGSGVRVAGVAAFADGKRVAAGLSRLDRLAARVTSMVPVTDVLVRRAAELGDLPYGALYVGGHASHLLLANPGLGIVTHRVLPVGTMTLVEAMAKGRGISVAEAGKHMREHDTLSGVPLVDVGAMDAVQSRSMSDRSLGPLLRDHVARIIATLDYFEHQRVSRLPERIELFGEVDRVAGFSDVLVNAMPVEIRRSAVSVFDLFCHQAERGSLNLLEHRDITIGKGRAAGAPSGRADTPRAGAKPSRNPSRNRRSASEPAGRRRGQARGGGTLADLIQRLRGGAAGQGDGNRDDGDENGDDGAEKAAERKNFLMFGLLCGLLGLLAWMKYQDLETPLRSAAGAAATKFAENSQLHIADAGGHRSGATSTDKVLWTEKFLSIGHHLDQSMWLTDVYLVTDRRQAGNTDILTKKLEIEGAVLPATQGHLHEIAGFISRLESDDAQFMGDFREIRFKGLTLDQAETDPIIRFGIEAVYDENKRVQTQAARKPNNVLDDVEEKARLRNERLNQAAGGSR